MTNNKKKRKNERGFALLIIVLLVALMALMGAALLDLVSVDLTIAGEHSKTIRANMVADGALREVIADSTTAEISSELMTACSNTSGIPCPDYRYDYAGEIVPDSGNFFKDPDNVGPTISPLLPGTQAMDETQSTFAMWTSGPGAQDYQDNFRASIDHLKVVPMMDCGNMVCRAVVREVITEGQTAGGDASSEVRAEMYTITAVARGTLLPRVHRR